MPATATGLTLVTPPAAEPITLTEAKGHLREDDTGQDALITTLITAAREYVEQRTTRALVTQTWDVSFAAFPRDGVLLLPKAPLASVTTVKYRDGANVEQTLAATAYDTDPSALPGRVSLATNQTWPTTYVRPQAVTVRLVAGYGAPLAVPAPLVAAMKLALGHWYANRESVITGTIATALPMAFEALLAPYLVVEVA